MLQLSPRVLEEATRRHEVPSTQLGRTRLYSKSALLAFVRQS